MLYNLFIFLYERAIWLAAIFNTKAKQWIVGREGIFEKLSADFSGNTSPVAWFHCASLGEFEQGRPVIEAFSVAYPHYKILLTFFSPSGYEVRKNYAQAHGVYYLPADTRANAQRFVALLQPTIAFFVKYEFWHNYLSELNRQQIPVISFSAIFRKNQIFFQSYGGFYRKILALFTHIFVQNHESFELLKGIGIEQVSIGGDTRFDRVIELAKQAKQLPIVEVFKQNQPLLVVGSAWDSDMEVLLPFLNKTDLKIIIAPHEINNQEIADWQLRIFAKSVRYSTANRQEIADAKVLILDNVGLLSSVYNYAEYAWIGGGYGKGLHNILEAVTFGIPVFFGSKNYRKFQEANDLIGLQVAFAITKLSAFEEIILTLEGCEPKQQKIREASLSYILTCGGATQRVINFVIQLLTK